MLVKSVRQRDRDVFIFIYTYFLSINMPVIMVLSVVLGHVKQRGNAHPHFFNLCYRDGEFRIDFLDTNFA